MARTIHFNTGRLYTAFGQRITATLHDDGVVTFMDHDRGVCGEYDELSPERFGRASVMAAYDSCYRNSTTRSMQAGMYPGSVNSVYVG